MSKLESQDILCYIDSLLKYSNYRRAAQSLYISQPLPHKGCQENRNWVGLWANHSQQTSVPINRAGKIYYQYLTSLEHSYAKLIREISYVSEIDNKVLRIGILPSLGSYLTPLFLPDFLKLHPAYKINLVEDLPEKMRNVSKIMSWTSGSGKIQAVSPLTWTRLTGAGTVTRPSFRVAANYIKRMLQSSRRGQLRSAPFWIKSLF